MSVKLLVSCATDPAHSVKEMLYKQALPSNAYNSANQTEQFTGQIALAPKKR